MRPRTIMWEGNRVKRNIIFGRTFYSMMFEEDTVVCFRRGFNYYILSCKEFVTLIDA